MDPNDEPEVYDPKLNPKPPTPAPHSFDRKYFDQFARVRRDGQRFEGEVYAPYGLHKGLPIEGPPNMDQIWPFSDELAEGDKTNYLGEDWKQKAPPEYIGGLWRYQMPHLESELIKDVTFIKVLGKGLYGSVWEVIAQHRADVKQKWPDQIAEESGKSKKEIEKVRFALKVVRHDGDEGRRQLFEDSLNEMLILRYLRHENLCNIKDFIGIPDRKTGFPYAKVCIFLELCNGTLLNILKEANIDYVVSPVRNKRILPEDLSRQWFRHAVRGLEYLHREGIVHRDIKGDNILYLSAGVPSGALYQERFLGSIFKLADFGLSKTEDYFKKLNKPEMLALRKRDDVIDLFGLLLDYGVPDCDGDLFSRSRALPDNFDTYCKTHEWQKGYPIDWKKISSELQDLIYLFKSQDGQVSALDLLNHPWLQSETGI